MRYIRIASIMISVILVVGCSSQNSTNGLAQRIEKNPMLTKEEKEFAKRITNVRLHVLHDNMDQARATFESPGYRLPAELLNSDVFRKWGFNPADDLTMEEKYYLFSIPQLDDTWKRIGSIDLNKLNPEEKRFLQQMHEEFGSGPINLRQKTLDKQSSLTSDQQNWFDLIMACTGDDILDDKGLVILNRLTPR